MQHRNNMSTSRVEVSLSLWSFYHLTTIVRKFWKQMISFSIWYMSQAKIIEALKVNGPFFAMAMRQNEGHFGFSFQSMSQDFQGLINSLPLCPVKWTSLVWIYKLMCSYCEADLSTHEEWAKVISQRMMTNRCWAHVVEELYLVNQGWFHSVCKELTRPIVKVEPVYIDQHIAFWHEQINSSFKNIWETQYS